MYARKYWCLECSSQLNSLYRKVTYELRGHKKFSKGIFSFCKFLNLECSGSCLETRSVFVAQILIVSLLTWSSQFSYLSLNYKHYH